MTSVDHDGRTAESRLLQDFSLEITGKDVDQVGAVRGNLPHGTRVHVTYLANEDLGQRLAAVRAVSAAGFIPVPHISARRLASQQELRDMLAALRAENSVSNVFVVAGDPDLPAGPYEDSMSIIETGLLQQFGALHVGISGYPDGHPQIASSVLWNALTVKAKTLGSGGLQASVITQFTFDAAAVLSWVAEARRRGITVPIRVGMPGPVGVKRLLSYSRRFGVGTSASIAKKYGFSITNLMSTAGPDRFIKSLTEGYRPELHGELGLHFYTFGDLSATAAWVTAFGEDR